MIGRFCGNTFPLKNGNIVSSHNSLYFWFHSDNSISHDGFAFEWNSIEPVCGGTLTNDYGTISSPGSPGRYPPNRDCYWTITVKSSKRIQIHFGQLMLEEHPSCEADFLEVNVICRVTLHVRINIFVFLSIVHRSALYITNDWGFIVITLIRRLLLYQLPKL